MKERSINSNKSFIADHKSPEIANPGKGSFNLPSPLFSSQFSAILCFGSLAVFAMGAYKFYSSLLELVTKWIAVVAFVRDQALGPALRPARAVSWNLDLFKGLINECHFRRGCRGKEASQRNTLTVDHHHPLCTFTFLRFANTLPPFFAGAKLPSMNASSQCKSVSSSRSARYLRHTSSQTPFSSQSFRRRQQVDALGYRSGRSFHRAPVLRIQSIPSNAMRLSAHGLPPCGPGISWGRNGSSFSHCSSVKYRVSLAIGSPPNSLIPEIIENV